MQIPLFYRQKPVFGLDIGHSTVKLVQLKQAGRHVKVAAYGYGAFDGTAISKGEIVKPEAIAKVLKPLMDKQVIGELTTDRVALSIPVAYTFTRILTLPQMSDSDLAQAIQLEAEQYIPIPLAELYLEHEVINSFTDKDKDEEKFEITVVATPKQIVDSYIKFIDRLGLETNRIEPSLFGIMRSVQFSRPTDKPKVVIDFGAKSSDLAVYDTSHIRIISTINTGGDHITERLTRELGLTYKQAFSLKARHGIAKSPYQQKVAKALLPILTELSEEVLKMIRYYHDREGSDKQIDGIMLVGGGSNMPGLTGFLKQLTGLETTICNPWENLELGHMQPPHQLEVTLYNTAVGLALEELQ